MHSTVFHELYGGLFPDSRGLLSSVGTCTWMACCLHYPGRRDGGIFKTDGPHQTRPIDLPSLAVFE